MTSSDLSALRPPAAAAPFAEDPALPAVIAAESALVVDLGSYEGPLDVLLDLARRQKVDLARISILKLAEQYLAFIAAAKRKYLQVAADYLVMAAWLAYLKSRLLLPPDERTEAEPSPEELAERLARQLRHLEAIRVAARKLQDQPQLGRDVFGRGAPEGLTVDRQSIFGESLYDLLRAYGAFQRRRQTLAPVRVRAMRSYSVEDALERLRHIVGEAPDWCQLEGFLPPELIGDPMSYRVAVSTMLVAGLEMARSGQVEIRQGAPFGPIYFRRPANPPIDVLAAE